jgi:hypothetical protein
MERLGFHGSFFIAYASLASRDDKKTSPAAGMRLSKTSARANK